MIDVLVSTVAFSVVVAVLLVLAVLVVVAPVYMSLQMADTRRFSTTRWGAISLALVLVALVAAYAVHKADVPKLVPLLPLLLAWGGPGILWLLDEESHRIGGRAGAHE